MPATKHSLLSFVGLALMLTITFGCGGPPPAANSASGPSGEIPELTDEIIHERINDAWVREVPPAETATNGANAANATNAANGNSLTNLPLEPISWGFSRDEPKEIVVVDKQMNGTKATIVLDIKTGSSPRSRNNLQLAGQIRTEWELRTGWVLRKWEIVDTENISMKYRRFPKSPTPAENKAENTPPGP
jgi:hypothetical protein